MGRESLRRPDKKEAFELVVIEIIINLNHRLHLHSFFIRTYLIKASKLEFAEKFLKKCHFEKNIYNFGF